MNANCSKYAANKTIQKLCSSNSSKEIDLTLNHLSMSEHQDDDDQRHIQNVTTSSVLHTTSHHHPHQTTILPQTDFAFNVLPPNKSESERQLRQLIDECVEETERLEIGLASLEKCLAKMKENQEKIEAMKKENRGNKGSGVGGNGKGESAEANQVANVKAKIKKIEKEIQTLKKKEAQREKEEMALKKRWEELRGEEDNVENCIKEDEGAERERAELEDKIKMIEALTSWPIQS